MEDEGSGWSVAFETEKSVLFIDIPFIMTIEQDLSALNFSSIQVTAAVHWEGKVRAPETVEDTAWKVSKYRPEKILYLDTFHAARHYA